MWENYLLGQGFVMMSDHSGIRYLFDQANLNAKNAKWLDTPSDIDFDINYIKENGNKVSYTLSRRVHVNHISVVSSYGTDLQE